MPQRLKTALQNQPLWLEGLETLVFGAVVAYLVSGQPFSFWGLVGAVLYALGNAATSKARLEQQPKPPENLPPVSSKDTNF
jgi:drug/metabolite transporter (DMT)-like permease